MVRKGKKVVGEQCNSMRASEDTQGFCYGHYMNWCKVNAPEVVKEKELKRRASHAEFHEKRKTPWSRTVKKGDKAAMVPLPEDATVREQVLKVMGFGQAFDLEVEYSLYKELGMGKGQENYDEMFAYALWLDSPANLRSPRDKEGVSKVLGVSIHTLLMWERSPNLHDIRIKKLDTIFDNGYKLFLEKLMEGVALGDTKFMQIYQAMMKERKEKVESRPSLPQLPDALKKQVDEAAGDNPFVTVRSQTKPAEQAAVFNAMANGSLKPEMEN